VAGSVAMPRALLRSLSSYAFVLGVLPIVAACSVDPSDGSDSSSDAIRMDQLPIKVTQHQEGLFDQEIDHPTTPAASLGTFKQRYWYSTEFASGPDAPVLFMFCGEAECGPWALNSFGDVAKSLHASIVALEHRYYGPSKPFTEMSLEKMKYLTIHNALEDAASFELFAKASLPLAGKWIATGGSYAGMLSAFYREKHPELVVGAWASSAPVNMQRVFTGYDMIVSRALGSTCLLSLHQAVDYASHAYDIPEQRKALSLALFGVEWKDEWGKDSFLSSIGGESMGAVQYGYFDRLCTALSQHALNPIDGIIAYKNPPLTSDPDDGPPPPPPERQIGGLDPLGARGFARRLALVAKPDDTGDSSYPSWFYQVCTEVGLYQVANPDRTASVMQSSDDEASFDAMCDQYVHGRPDVAKTRAEYYDPIVAGTVSNVFWVNGALDPWSPLGFTDPSRPPGDSTVFVVQNGSHCTDMGNLKRDSAIPVFEAHAKFVALAKNWLAH
jgi:hypothetical protein